MNLGIELDARQRTLLIGSALAMTLHAFDEMAVITALPVIVNELGGRALYGTALFSYLLTSLIGLVAAGWLATRYGPGRPLAYGLAIFAFGLALAGVAPNMEWVVVARAMQGLGGGILNTVAFVIVNRAFEARERAGAMAFMSVAWVAPALIAPGAAGFIAETFGWRWVFVGILPLAAVAAAVALPATRSLEGSTPDGPFARQFIDGVRLAAGLGLVLTALGREPSLQTALAIAAGCWLFAPALGRVLPTGSWTGRSLVGAAILAKVLLAGAFFGVEGFIPLALADIHGTGPAYAGFALTVASVTWTAGAFVQARLARRHAPRRLASLGALGVVVAIAIAATTLSEANSPALVFVAWFFGGAGMGIVYNTLSTSAMAHSPAGREGSLSTALGVSDAVGISLGTGLGGALVSFGDRTGWHTAESLGLAWALMGLAALLACAICLRTGSAVIGNVDADPEISGPGADPATR